MRHNPPLITLKNASLERSGRILWEGLQAMITPGEFIAVLGPNGAGKSSLLKVLLGLLPLTTGTALIEGKVATRGNKAIGYVPQQKGFDPLLPIRGRDLVELGITGHRYGFSGNTRTGKLVQAAVDAVGAGAYADKAIGRLSGGEQQRLRIAQALAGQPSLLLCDEPLLSLDLASQSNITALLHDYRQAHDAAIIFVTHEINPVLPYVDRILYLANGRWVIDTPDNVLTTAGLSELYGTTIEVLRVHDRILVVGTEDEALTVAGIHHTHEEAIGDAH